MSDAPHHFPFHIGDYLRDTRGLSLAEHGAYLMLMLEYYSSGKPLRADAKTLYKVTGAHTQFERKVVDRIVARFFENGDGLYKHSRIEKEIDCYRDRASSARKAAKQKWANVVENQTPKDADQDANAMRAQCGNDASAMPTRTITNNLKPKPQDLGVSRLSNPSNDNGSYTLAHSHSRSASAFDSFWERYPRKKSKGDALKAWNAIKPDVNLSDAILQGVEHALHGADWQKESGRFIPYPATWLRARGWEDESRPAEPESKTGRGLVALERMKKNGK